MSENIVITKPNEYIGNVYQVNFTKHLRYHVNQLMIDNYGAPFFVRLESAFGAIHLTVGERYKHFGVIRSISSFEHGISVITSGNGLEEFGINLLISFSY